MKILTVIGARPQIIKASALSRAVKKHYSQSINEVIVHTGQHYDRNMSKVFFSELDIPKEKYNLGVGSASHGVQTANIIIKLEEILLKEKPDCIVLYGDTNSTLAGAVAASKIQVPIVHIEAGLRSFDKNMPEEINRIMCDHVSTLLFSPTQVGYNNLVKEGFSKKIISRPDFNHPNIYHCGDIMYDNTMYFKDKSLMNEEYKTRFGNDFILCTIHRNTNTDNKENLTNIFSAFIELSKQERIILPLHPRTKKMMPLMLESSLLDAIKSNKNIEIIDPVSFLEMIYLEASSKLIVTDSGGVQKESYYLEKPCIILRPQTEWVEIVDTGNAFIANTDKEKIINTAQKYLSHKPKNYPKIFGDAHAAEFILQTMLDCLG